MDLGGTKIEVAVFDDDNEVLGSTRHPTPIQGGPPDVAAAIVIAVNDACDQAGVKPEELVGVGVGSPGVVDSHAGTVSGARNLPDWEAEFPLGPELSETLGPPVAVGNDVAVATDAEFEHGAGKPYHSILGVFWGTGVGGGIVLDGHPWHGRGAAGEIGHMVVKIGGRQCGCGRKGMHGGLRGPGRDGGPRA